MVDSATRMKRSTQLGFILLLDVQFFHFLEQSATHFVDEFPLMGKMEQVLPGAVGPLFLLFNVAWIAAGLASYLLWVRPGRPAARGVILTWICLECLAALVCFVWAATEGGHYVSGLVTSFLLLGAAIYLAVRLPPRAARAGTQ